MTQAETDILQIRNVSATACTMEGYPDVTLTSTAGTKLAYQYRDGGGQMLTTSPPRLVTLGAGGTALAGISKTDCSVPGSNHASHAVIALPGVGKSSTVALPLPLDFCSASDPGHVIYVSPFEPTLPDVLHQP